jgi:hypothetical protein
MALNRRRPTKPRNIKLLFLSNYLLAWSVASRRGSMMTTGRNITSASALRAAGMLAGATVRPSAVNYTPKQGIQLMILTDFVNYTDGFPYFGIDPAGPNC